METRSVDAQAARLTHKRSCRAEGRSPDFSGIAVDTGTAAGSPEAASRLTQAVIRQSAANATYAVLQM